MSRIKCNDCNAGRGLAEYPEGTYCHACHQFTRMTKSLIKRLDVQTNKKELELPECKPAVWPEEAKEWIRGYLEPVEDVVPFFWSDEYQRIVFPQYVGDDRDGMLMVAAWMRSIDNQPKWMFAGDKDVVFKYRRHNDSKLVNSICITEDVVSAIKASEVMDSIALGGTVLKANVYSHIGMNGYTKVYIFLDNDEAGKKGAEFARRRLSLLCDCVIVRGTKDPKAYQLDELRELLSDN